MNNAKTAPFPDNKTLRGGTLLLFTLLFIAAAFVWWNHQRRFRGDAHDVGVPELEIEGADLGELWETPELRHRLLIHNRSKSEVTIERFATSCKCVSLAPQAVTVSPGTATEVVAKFDLRSQLQESAATEFAATIMPVVAGKQVQAWTLKGNLRTPFTLSTRYLDFGETNIDGPQRPPLTLEVGSPIFKTGITAKITSPEYFSCSVSSPANGSHVYTLSLQVSKSIPLGPLDADLLISPNAATGMPLPTSYVHIHCLGVRGAELIPARVSLAGRDVGDTCRESVTLRARGKHPVHILRIAANSPDLNVQARNGSTAGDYTIFLVQRISSFGAQQTSCTFTLQLGDGSPPFDLVLPVAYHGIALNRNDGLIRGSN